MGEMPYAALFLRKDHILYGVKEKCDIPWVIALFCIISIK
jgi:hypothetical protein